MPRPRLQASPLTAAERQATSRQAASEGSRLAEKLEAIAELDLAELQAVESPRGYGRD